MTTSAPIVVGDTVVIGCEGGILSTHDRTSGRQKWQFSVGGSEVSSPAVVDGTIYVGSQYGVHALEGNRVPWTALGTLAGLTGFGGVVGYAFWRRL